ncbi:MAG TPA: DUF4013 domain-containing protein [Methanobacterium sp.]|nr:DUF4013 domain-containing protein [Methanobacterium sp.]
MNLKDTLVDSLKYTSSNWLKVILLGLVIFLADKSNELSNLGGFADEIRYIIIIIGTILGIYQLGFIFRILEETTKGSNKMPKFDKFLTTFIHGLKETIVTVIYFIIPFIVVLLGFAMLAYITGPKTEEMDLAIIFSGLFLGSLTYLLYQATVLNMADYHGTLRSAFDFNKIYKKFRAIGFKKLGFIYLLTVIFAAIVEVTLSDTKSILPYGLGDIISSFLIAPFILIFIARTLGLINKSLEPKNN